MPAPKNKNKQPAAKVAVWEDWYLETNEKKHIEILLKRMHLPAHNEEFDPLNLDKICENVCLGLKIKLPEWERFLLNKPKRKSKKYKCLESHVFDYIMKGGNQPRTRG